MSEPKMLEQIISGAQTGVDRAVLDAALAHRFPCGECVGLAGGVGGVSEARRGLSGKPGSDREWGRF